MRKGGLEPPRISPPDPKSGASANSATFASSVPCASSIAQSAMALSPRYAGRGRSSSSHDRCAGNDCTHLFVSKIEFSLTKMIRMTGTRQTMRKTAVWNSRRGRRWICAGLLAAAVPVCSAGGAALRSPWDGAVMKATDAPYNCPAVKHLPVDFVTNGFYKTGDPTRSIVDFERMKSCAESAGPVKHDGNVIVAAADTYRTTGSLPAAQCVIELLEANARGTITSMLPGHC